MEVVAVLAVTEPLRVTAVALVVLPSVPPASTKGLAKVDAACDEADRAAGIRGDGAGGGARGSDGTQANGAAVHVEAAREAARAGQIEFAIAGLWSRFRRSRDRACIRRDASALSDGEVLRTQADRGALTHR